MSKAVIPYDSFGIIASTLCMIHCIATPFIFIAKACSATCCSDAPLWWQVIDYLFLIISFIAIYFISKNLSIRWLKMSFWISWVILLFTILNHSLLIVNLPNNFIYIPAIAIIILHFYNLQFCKCQNDTCCTQ
mgnify:CR=1 FL=1|tara:strand:+ start:1731 stop:2129 length:399 start_codon:yes stop_codon:yes gene_type:complete